MTIAKTVTRQDISNHISDLVAAPFRVVESQHVNATRKLVDTDEEYEILEHLVDGIKPRIDMSIYGQFHYLLFSPFRYSPLKHGSRFGARFEPSLWYGSIDLSTAICESAYYRLCFLLGTEADIGQVNSWFTSYQTKIDTHHGLDLTSSPFSNLKGKISAPDNYQFSQRLGTLMRERSVTAFQYFSARTKSEATNVGVFNINAFASREPVNDSFASWQCFATKDQVIYQQFGLKGTNRFRYTVSDFFVNDKFPAPAI